MKHNVKEYINKEFLDKDGFYTINVNLYKGFSLYNELSFDKQKELNDEIFNYIDNKSEVIPNEYKLKIKFIGRKLDEEDKKRIEYLIHEHYYVVMENVKRELDKLTYKMVLLLLLGFVGFTLYYIFVNRIAFNSLLLEFLGLVGSFSIWESIGLFVFDRKDISTNEYFIENIRNDNLNNKELNQIKLDRYQKLDKMISLALSNKCIHQITCEYFGHKHNGRCMMCSNCKK